MGFTDRYTDFWDVIKAPGLGYKTVMYAGLDGPTFMPKSHERATLELA